MNSTIIEGASTTAVEVGSRGGNGQRGEPGGVGKAGGNAGTVSFQQLAPASGSGVQARSTSLVSVYSIGGWGGVGQAGLGRGGSAGGISAVLDASIATQGDNFTGLWVRSEGGQTGNNVPDVVVTSAGPLPFGFSTASLAQPWKSANGGQVNLNTASKYVVSTQGDRAFGIVLESVGGASAAPHGASRRAHRAHRAPDAA
ncbi:hypothetical protein LB518_06915 [Mesorhizobium sp. BR1-1-16]|uniref:hypothetical protein n=1 Tax=Mesorhizobium sp. BR1-1-16 TaxID=2876653 RepID=UPI001CC9B048|nr:hypothetical protein [Mesorhizobium sp. BR1-1-16]MBZ9936017.1 hypothetical protein [Mesorhizobium sp. BR1-1-16]